MYKRNFKVIPSRFIVGRYKLGTPKYKNIKVNKFVKITYTREKINSNNKEKTEYIAGAGSSTAKDLEHLVREMLHRGYFVVDILNIEYADDPELLKQNNEEIP